MPERRKAFDCLKFKWQVQEKISHDIGKMGWNQEVEYFRNAAEKGRLGRWWKEVKLQKERLRKRRSS